MPKVGPTAMTKLKRVLRSLKGTLSIRIGYSEYVDDGDKLTTHVDSDHAGDQTGILDYWNCSLFRRWPSGLEVYKANGGGHLNEKRRIRRHGQGVRDGLALSELVGIDEWEAGAGNRNVRG